MSGANLSIEIDPLFPLGEFSHYVVEMLPKHNMNDDFEQVAKGNHFLPDFYTIQTVAFYSPFEVRIRSMGDLGIYLVSCLRAGIPMEKLSPIYDSLCLLSPTTGVVPRDTYCSYATHNSEEAMRTFTGHESEIGFIRQHQRSDEALMPAVDHLLQLQTANEHVDYGKSLTMIRDCVKKLIDENKNVHQAVDPVFFIKYFREYFFPIEIQGKMLNAPSGVHLANIILLDIGVGSADARYLDTTDELMMYLEPIERLKIMQAKALPSLREKFIKEYKTNGTNREELNLLMEIYKYMRIYRYVHQGLVTRYIRKQDTNVKFGTGGFPFDEFLEERIQIVKKAEEDVRKAFAQVRE
ncbi:protein of unknown function [Thermoactinomyces sp. DSM 45891]|uniref:monodechloroaminopyrrolnitrin synthase PrnB family protein n=1 Tax=Thermoactinomyces sp. DSM 45891 TaxID=1761907 RepID=UPI00091A1676|nr:monodechloroaminopyrrolnitrin synthase PrnB family protein [Thermoactinomyces sp. DSM 45891]SFX64503.1 protein of unknown function [Thermoactinomyces sp. DSM 45891]